MSAIAWFYIVDRSDLGGFVRAAASSPGQAGEPSPLSYLSERAHKQDLTDDAFVWSGYVMAYMLGYLAESGVDLGRAEFRDEGTAINETFGATCLITSADKVHLPALDATQADYEAFARYFDDMNFGLDDELNLAVQDGLDVLHELITALDDHEVLIVHIG